MTDEKESDFSPEDFEVWSQQPITRAMVKKARARLAPAQHELNMFAAESSDAKVRGAYFRLLTINQFIEALEGQ